MPGVSATGGSTGGRTGYTSAPVGRQPDGIQSPAASFVARLPSQRGPSSAWQTDAPLAGEQPHCVDEEIAMDFNLPELGEGVYEAEAVRWLVKSGDTIKPGQTLLEVLTDKATMEVPAPFAGVIQELLVEAGAKLTIGQPILRYEDKKGAP